MIRAALLILFLFTGTVALASGTFNGASILAILSGWVLIGLTVRHA